MSATDGGQHEAQRLAAELLRLSRELAATTVLSLSVRERTDLLVGIERASRGVEAARLAVIRSLDGDAVGDLGATSLAGLLRSRLQSAPGRARADVETARAVDPDAPPSGVLREEKGSLAGMGAALGEGAVSREHVDAARRTLQRVPHALRAGAAATIDEFFVAVSRRHPPRECESLASQLLDRLDPSRTERSYDPDAFARRRFDMVTDGTGMLIVRGQLDPMTGAQLKAAVEHFAAPDPAALGEDGLPLGRDPRAPTQRRADALGLVASRALAGAGTRGGEPPRVVVHATVDQLAALAAGRDHAEQAAAGRAWCEQTGFITPDVLARIGCGALFERVLSAPSGAVLELGRAARLASPAQRRALGARDGGCVVPGCTRPPQQCDAHHVTSWVSGGRTDVAELALLCGPHHNGVHAGAIDVEVRDGVPWVQLPACRYPGADPGTDPDSAWVRCTLREDAATARETGRQIRLDLGLDPPPDPSILAGGSSASDPPGSCGPPVSGSHRPPTAGPPRAPWCEGQDRRRGPGQRRSGGGADDDGPGEESAA